MDQRNQEDHLNIDNEYCPANAEWWDKQSFYGYYKVAFSPGKVASKVNSAEMGISISKFSLINL
jgi:hypothetical protein